MPNLEEELISKLRYKSYIIEKDNNLFINFNNFSLFKITNFFIEDNILILKSKNKQFEFWINQDLFIPPWETHWFQLKDSFLLKLKENILHLLIKRGIKKAGNLPKLCESLRMSNPTFYNFINNKGIKMVSVGKLKRLLNYLDINYSYLNDKIEYTKKGNKISIKNPKFPINLANIYGASLLGMAVSDGSVYIDKKARNIIRTKYSTSEIESIKKFIKILKKIYGNILIQKEEIRNCYTLRIGSSIVGDSLIKVGAILGNKTKLNKGAPWLVKFGPKSFKTNYLQSIFDDEASLYYGRGSYLTLTRYKAVKNLTDTQKIFLEEIEPKMKLNIFPTGHINKKITLKRVFDMANHQNKFISPFKIAPNLLIEESMLLNEMGIENRLWADTLNKNHSGTYSLSYTIFINKKASILKFYKEIGFSLNHKQNKLRKIIKAWEGNGVKSIQYTNQEKVGI